MLINKIKNKATDEVNFSGANTFINPFSYMMLRNNPDYLDAFDRVYFDGSLAVIIFTLLFRGKFNRRSFDFTSLADDFFKFTSSECSKIAIIGSTKEALSAFLSLIKHKYPKIDIVYTRDGYFDDGERLQIVQDIIESDADFLIVGMGTPYQEKFIDYFYKNGGESSTFTCGGFIHQTASTTDGNYYPKIFDKLNIRWVYRMIDEPKLIKRYFIQYPLAVACIFLDFCRYKISNRNI